METPHGPKKQTGFGPRLLDRSRLLRTVLESARVWQDLHVPLREGRPFSPSVDESLVELGGARLISEQELRSWLQQTRELEKTREEKGSLAGKISNVEEEGMRRSSLRSFFSPFFLHFFRQREAYSGQPCMKVLGY